MVVAHIWLRERRIDQVVGRGVLPLQKELGGKLIIRPQEIDLGVVQRHILHILHELTVVIVPEDQLARIPGKLSVESVYDLFDVHFCHSAFLLLNLCGALPSTWYVQCKLKFSPTITRRLFRQSVFFSASRKHSYHSILLPRRKGKCRFQYQFSALAPAIFSCPSSKSSKSGFEDRL